MTRPALALVLVVAACSKTPDPVVPPQKNRCEVDLGATGMFATDGSGASAVVITEESQFIGGEAASAKKGDFLLQNDRVRVIVEQPGRSVGPIPNGGQIIDADIQRASGQAGHDAFGRMNLIYGMGRLSSVHQVEVLNDGSRGGPAVVASTGHDSLHDLINLRALLENEAGLAVSFVIDQYKPQELRTTTYYVLSPGESRVRVLTAFCNDGTKGQGQPLIELMDMGAFELFFPGGCSNGLGAQLDLNGCLVQTSKWVGAQGRDVAYGYRPMSIDDPKQPSGKNAMIGYGGVVGAFIEGESLSGVLSWTDAMARSRPGTFVVRPGGVKLMLSDFVVASDLAGVSGALAKYEGIETGRVDVSVGLAGARVSAVDFFNQMTTLAVADANGNATLELPGGEYTLTASAEGRVPGPKTAVTVTAGQRQSVTVTLSPSHVLHVNVKDVNGVATPAKVTVHCHGAECAFNRDTWKQHELLDYPTQGAAAIEYAGVSGSLDIRLPAGQYDVVVSRGPEFSTWPDTWPNAGKLVDLSAADATVDAVIGQIIDSANWMSADLHVHAVNSPDSSVRNEQRVLNFLAEGIDVLLSTDHEFIFDYAPTVRAMGAENHIATMVGEEITTFSHGHFNAFPLIRKPEAHNGGAFDHAGGEDGSTLRMTQFFDGVHTEHPGSVVQLNHPRGAGGGVLTTLRVDTATLRSHGNPADYNMEADPTATSQDTKLFSDKFDIVETANGPNASWAVMNDWMTFLSRGTVRTASGVSDSHKAQSDSGGYARTYALVGVDTPAAFTPAKYADAIRARQAFVTNGPFLRFSAKKVSGGNPVDIGGTLSVSGTEDVELTVDVTGPEWMQVDRVEIYSHASGRDAVNGESNGDWPEARILAKHDITNPTIEAVPGAASLRRVHLTEKFTFRPAADTWYVAMARGTVSRNMWPLHRSRPQAYSNAILIDADGTGKYDDFPLKPGQALSAWRPPQQRQPIVPTVAQAEAAIRKLLSHEHE